MLQKNAKAFSYFLRNKVAAFKFLIHIKNQSYVNHI